jgi:hypothetical protein
MAKPKSRTPAPTLLGGKSAAAPAPREWDALDQVHCDFAAGINAVMTILVHHLIVNDGAIKPEALRDELEDHAAKAASAAARIAAAELSKTLAIFIRTRDVACFSRRIEIAREQGRVPAEGQGSA